MKIEKAIEILKKRKKGRQSIGQFDDVEAIQLGIEALKREQRNRKDSNYVLVGPLPGETEKEKEVKP